MGTQVGPGATSTREAAKLDLRILEASPIGPDQQSGNGLRGQPQAPTTIGAASLNPFIPFVLSQISSEQPQAAHAAAAAKSLQSCPTLCDPIDGSPPGSLVPGVLQARTLEWVAISFSNARK